MTPQNCECTNKTLLDSKNPGLDSISLNVYAPGFVEIDLEEAIGESDILDLLPSLGIDRSMTLELVDSYVDDRDETLTHNLYQQYYNGIPVDGGVAYFHFIDCLTYLFNGNIFECIDTPTNPTIKTEAELLSVLQENISRDATLKPSKVPLEKSLIITQDLTKSCDYILAYKKEFEIKGNKFSAVIDANTKRIIKTDDFMRNILANTLDYGEVNLDDKLPSVGKRQLKTDNSVDIFETLQNFGKFKRPRDATRWLDVPEAGMDARYAYQAHHCATQAVNYLNNNWSDIPNISFIDIEDNDFGGIHPELGLDITQSNMLWNDDDNSIRVLIFDNQHSIAMDVLAHEIGHGIVFDKSNIPNSLNVKVTESLLEHLADLYGHVFDEFLKGSPDWTIGEDCSEIIRDVSNLPDFDHRTDFADTDITDQNLHNCSNLATYWAFMLVTPNTHPQSGLTSQGLFSLTEVVELANYAMESYLTATPNFEEYALATLFAAENIYGKCSAKVQEIIDVWLAVGIDLRRDCLEINVPHICEEDFGNDSGVSSYDVLLCVTHPSPNDTYIWHSSHDIWEVENQTNQFGNYIGNCLAINTLNYDGSYYPKSFTVYVEIEGADHGSYVTFQVNDCNGDDPDPCDGILQFDNQFFKSKQIKQADLQKAEITVDRNSNMITFCDTSIIENNIKLFDLSGNNISVLLSEKGIEYPAYLNGIYVIAFIEKGIRTSQTIYID